MLPYISAVVSTKPGYLDTVELETSLPSPLVQGTKLIVTFFCPHGKGPDYCINTLKMSKEQVRSIPQILPHRTPRS